jgi:hypothetical protein
MTKRYSTKECNMLEANKKRKKKTMGAILETANRHIQDYRGNYFWGQRIYYILRGVWSTAFSRGYEKALRDQSKPLREAIKYARGLQRSNRGDL